MISWTNEVDLFLKLRILLLWNLADYGETWVSLSGKWENFQLIPRRLLMRKECLKDYERMEFTQMTKQQRWSLDPRTFKDLKKGWFEKDPKHHSQDLLESSISLRKMENLNFTTTFLLGSWHDLWISASLRINSYWSKQETQFSAIEQMLTRRNYTDLTLLLEKYASESIHYFQKKITVLLNFVSSMKNMKESQV